MISIVSHNHILLYTDHPPLGTDQSKGCRNKKLKPFLGASSRDVV